MKTRLLKRTISLFLTLCLVVGLCTAVMPFKADAASQYITDIEVTSLTTSSAEISFHYGKNGSGDDYQILCAYLYDADTDDIVATKILRLTFSEGENWQGDYAHTFTGLSPERAYYAKIDASSGDKKYRSDEIPLTTPAAGTPQAELTVSQAKRGSCSFVLKGLLTATGTGHTVENGNIYNPAGETVMFRQQIIVENANGTRIYSGEQRAFQEELFSDSVMSRRIEVNGDIINPCTVKVQLWNSHGMMGEAAKTFNFIAPPTLDSDSVTFTATEASHFTGNLAAEVSADPNDTLISVTAARSGGTETVSGTWDSVAGLYRFNFAGLAPGTEYHFYIDALCASGRYVSIGDLIYTTPPAPTAPSVSTNAAGYLRSDGAKLGGIIDSNGNAHIVGRGVVYATVASGNNHTDTLIIGGTAVVQVTDSVETQITPTDFSVSLRGLPPGTGYYYRAYAINSAGFTQYGSIESFSTLSVPLVITGAYSAVDTDSATLAGEVISTGGVSPTLRGFVLSRQINPSLGGDGVILALDEETSAATGAYDTQAAGLLADTTYYYRAFISSLKGTFYGDQQSFTTEALTGIPTVNLDIYNRPQTDPASKQVGASFTAPSGVTVVTTGFVFAETENPVIGGAATGNLSATADGSGNFVATLTGLSAGTTYYYRAYAAYATTDGDDTAYSAQGQFTTVAQLATGYSMPVITRTEVTDAAATTATAETDAAISGTGAPLLFSRMLYYSSTNNDPLPGGEDVTAVPANQLGMTGDGTTTTTVTGLMADTSYYLRTVTQNEQGTYYGGVVTFKTDAAGLAAVTNAEPFANGITFSGACVHGQIDPGGAPVTSYGVVWSSAETEPLLGSPLSLATIDTASFSQPESVSTSLSYLSAGTTYYYRYYAENSAGISYGPVESFMTISADPPGLSTSETIIAYRDWAEAGALVESGGTGGKALSQIGVLFSDDSAPEVSTPGSIVSSMGYTGVGEVRFPSAGLSASTGYYTRAFGITQDGTVYYGAPVSFTTLSPDVPVTHMDGFVPDSGASAEVYGGVSDDGGNALTGRGFVYGLSPAPVIGGSGVFQEADSGTDLGGFSATLAGLEEDILYYVRAYASNGIGIGYSDDMLVLLQSEPFGETTEPVVETFAATNITSSGATLTGEVVSDGGAPPVIARGFVYGTTTAPDRENDNDVPSGNGTGSFTETLTGLAEGTTYYVRTYAINEIGTAYGNVVSFTTSSSGDEFGLIVTTGSVSGITKTGATFSGSVTAQGGAFVEERGFVYGTTSHPAIGYEGVIILDVGGVDEGNFTTSASGLTPSTNYHVRAYAITGQGDITEYGEDRSFTTLSNSGGGGSSGGGYVPPENEDDSKDTPLGNVITDANEVGYLDMPETDNPWGNVILFTDSEDETHIIGLGIVEGERMKYISRGPGKYKIIYNAKPFNDIVGHWAKKDIDFSSARHLFFGVSPTLFAPNIAMTRGMFVTVIGRMYGADPTEYTNVPFDDVLQNVYYAPFIQWAAENGIVFGVSADKFEPERPVTRQEMAAIMYRFMTFLGLEHNNGHTPFNDEAQIADWAKKDVNCMRANGIISGKPGNIFDPNAASTRAEVAVVFRRLIEYIVNSASEEIKGKN